MTTKYEAFMAALEALCNEHGVELHPSLYDSIDVWSACRPHADPDPRRWLESFADHTEGDDQP